MKAAARVRSPRWGGVSPTDQQLVNVPLIHLATTATEIALLHDENGQGHHIESVTVHLLTHIALASVIGLHGDDLDLLFLTVGEIAHRQEMYKTGDQERELDPLREREPHPEQEHPRELNRQLGLEPRPEPDPRSEQGLQQGPGLPLELAPTL